MNNGYLGQIILFAGAQGFGWPPKNWMLCEGQILQINANQSLYSIIGTQYGGDGRTTFKLPKLEPIGDGCQYIICVIGDYPSRT